MPTWLQSEWHTQLLDRFNDANIESAKELRLQTKSAHIVCESSGYIDISIPASVPRIRSCEGFPIDGWYLDDDGVPVFLLLHLVNSTGYLSAIERYRPDGSNILNLRPNPESIRVQSHVRPTRDAAVRFDVNRGWYVEKRAGAKRASPGPEAKP